MRKQARRAAAAAVVFAVAAGLLACTAVQDTPDIPAPSSAYPQSEPPGRQLYRVDSVYDGDTLRVFTPQGESVQVRVLGIDAPEMQAPRPPEDLGRTDAPSPGPECGAVDAREAARAVLLGKSVELEEDPAQPGQDRYGRLLRYVTVDGQDLAHMLLYGGFVWVYTYYPVSRTPMYEVYQEDAREAERGGWAVCGWGR